MAAQRNHTRFAAARREAVELTRQFLRWWLGELTAMVPRRLRERFAARRERLILWLDGNAAALTLDSRSGSKPLGHAHLSGSGRDLRSIIADAALYRKIRRGKLAVAVRLPAAKALRTRIALPLAVEENLADVLRFELDQRTPFSPEAASFAYRVLVRDEAARQLHVELTVLPRVELAAALGAAERLGLKASALEIAAEGPGGKASDDLLAGSGAGRHSRSTRRNRIVLTAAALALLTAAYVPLHQAHEASGQLGRDLHAAKAAAARAVHIKTETVKLSGAENFLLSAKRAEPSATQILYEITHILPDDTWLTELNVSAAEVQLSGFSASSSALIGLLGRSTSFAEPKFRTAVTLDPSVGRERFEIAARIAAKAAP